MKVLNSAILVVVGLLNLYPLVGVISANQLSELYGVGLESPDLVMLMRHRAVLFGLLGAFIVYSVFNHSFRVIACIAGLISMMSFVFLFYFSGDFGNELQTVAIADIVGSVALIVMLLLSGRDKYDTA